MLLSPSLAEPHSSHSIQLPQESSTISPRPIQSDLTSRDVIADAPASATRSDKFKDSSKARKAEESQDAIKALENAQSLLSNHASQTDLATSNPIAKLGQSMSTQNDIPPRLITTDDIWPSNALRVDEASKSQAASSTEQGQTQSSNSNTTSQAASAVSATASQAERIRSVELDNYLHVGNSFDAKHPTRTVGVGGTDPTQTTPSDDSDSSDAWSQKAVLTFDGGGIRGYSSLLILHFLMKKIAELERTSDPRAGNSYHPAKPLISNTDESPMMPQGRSPILGGIKKNRLQETSRYLPCHYFDYIAGTSTGGLIAIMLGRFGMTIAQCLEAYEHIGQEVFTHPRPFNIRNFPLWSLQDKYDGNRLRDIFKEMVRKYEPSGLKKFPQKHPEMCRTITIATRRDKFTQTPYLFRSYLHPSSGSCSSDDGYCQQLNGDDYPIWKVARATTAAPFYFSAVQMEADDKSSVFIDGGFGTNNPSEQVYASIQELSDNDPKLVKTLVSIGTGKVSHPSPPKKALEQFSNSYIRWIPRFINSALLQATNSEKIHVRVKGMLKKDHVPYFRFNVGGIEHIKLDAFDGKYGLKTLNQLIDATREYLDKNKEARDQMNKLATLLVDVRRRRAYHHRPATSTAGARAVPEFNKQVSDYTSNAEPWQDRRNRWEIFVHGVMYTCNLAKSCDWYKDRLGTRQELRQHYIARHGLIANSSECSELEDRLDEAKRYPIQESATQNRRAEDPGASRRTTFASR